MIYSPKQKKTVSPQHVRAILDAFSAGDAIGMPTEFMTRQEIRTKFGLIDRLIEPSMSKNHPELPRGSVTDDTQQVQVLLDEYARNRRIEPKDTAMRLLRWMRESGAIEKRYIGPSSRSALEAIEAGADPRKSGMNGTTCGGVMRCPAAVLFAVAEGKTDHDAIVDAVHSCLMPTHETRESLESAVAYSFAMIAAIDGANIDQIVHEAVAGAKTGATLAPWQSCGASVAARLQYFKSIMARFGTHDEVLDFLYEIYGTGLNAVDTATGALCIFLYGQEDTWLCMRMGASVGGDTDTIAALSAALSAAYRFRRMGNPNIPIEISNEIRLVNHLDWEPVINLLFQDNKNQLA